MDFLFEYYAFRPSRLRRWSPGPGVTLLGPEASTYLEFQGFTATSEGVHVDPQALPVRRRRGVRWMLDLLEATQSRPPLLSCYALHEWAMVYRTDDIRHDVPLRLDPDTLAAFVESRTIRCTHYDAFRFFSPAARSLNQLQPTPDTMQALEQPGCLHANMDVYRWAFKLYPYLRSTLLIDALEVAIEARRLDMRAGPYDLRSEGVEPICIETSDGMAEFRHEQARVAALGADVRAQVIVAYQQLIDLFED